MAQLTGHGIGIDVPRGWDAEIYRRRDDGGGTTNAVLHLANFALPPDRGDYGAGAVEMMGAGGVLAVLFEFDREAAGTAAFSRGGIPRQLDETWFDPATLQRPLPGQSGCQVFANEAGRAFCLFVALGSHARRRFLLGAVNPALSTLAVD